MFKLFSLNPSLVININRIAQVSIHSNGELGLAHFLQRVHGDKIFSDKNLKRDLEKRGVIHDFDKLHKLWPVFTKYRSHKKNLTLSKAKLVSENASDTIVERLNVIQRELEILEKEMSEFEAGFLADLLRLPNSLHPETPSSDHIYYQHGQPQNVEAAFPSFLSLCQRYQVSDGGDGYFVGQGALLERCLADYFDSVASANSFIPFANTDIVRDFIAEGCCEQGLALTADDGSLRLTGAASLSSFCVQRARRSVNVKFLPERHFATGKRIYAVNQDGVPTQDSVCAFLSVSHHCGAKTEFEFLVEMMRQVYVALDLPFKIWRVGARRLAKMESYRLEVEVEGCCVAHLSALDDYISRRLNIYCHDAKNRYSYSRLVYANLARFHPLLEALMRRSFRLNSQNILFPDGITASYALKYKASSS